ncbi:MAG: dihydroorotate dehydrogenase electron transfer subunit [Firmicutes bacterium]|nr:dihydroorotate dehydrogenase electron transfer subunit [Bacillota bacterium]
MKQGIFEIKENIEIAKNTMKMVLEGDTSALTAPGQFVNIKIDGLFLRRPISVCDYNEKEITIIYKVVGAGTEAMAEMVCGQELDILTGLGNGYNVSKAGECPLLIGGGVGVPPMYGLAKALLAANPARKVQVVLGFNSEEEVFYAEEFDKLGAEVHVATADGSVGTKGFVTDVMKDLEYSYFFTCGPLPMFNAIEKIAVTSGQYSFEERMGCGFGACMGCSCKTKYGNKRICKDGPVLEREEIIW